MTASYIHDLRARVGPRKLILACTGVVLRDQDGRVLLHHRTDFDVWGLPGGLLELGETIRQCARRELLEETGYRAGDMHLVGLYSEPEWDVTFPNGHEMQQFCVLFEAPSAGRARDPDAAESHDVRWFPSDALPELPPGHVRMLADVATARRPAFAAPQAEPITEPQIETVRAVIGSDPYIAPAVAGVVVDSGQVLVARRADDGYWVFPGGALDIGENAAAAVSREVRDKTGLTVVPEGLLGIQSEPVVRHDPNDELTQFVVAAFRCRATGGLTRADGAETSDVAWCPPEELALLPMTGPQHRLRDAVLRHLDAGWFVIP